MKLRYKATGTETFSNRFNVHGIGEALTGDDSCIIKEMDVWINGQWKDMAQAFRDKDIIPDNHNEFFSEPLTPEDRERGYIL